MSDLFAELASKIQEVVRTPNLHSYKPAEQQVAFHSCQKKQRLILGGNRSGKSYSNVVEMAWWATKTHPYRKLPDGPLALRHVAVDRPQGIEKVLKELYKKIVPPEYLLGGSFQKAWKTEPPTLQFKDGTFIEFLSYEQDLDKHAGTSRHAIAFDEEPDQAIFNENLARLIDTDGDWWIAMTPVEGLSWVYDRFYLPYEEGTLDDSTELFFFRTEDNFHLPKGSFDRLMSGLTAEERETRKSGKFISMSGLIYPFGTDTHVLPLKPQPNLLTVAGMDHGLRNPTAWLWAQIDADGTFFILREHYATEMLVNEHAKVIKIIESGHPLLVPSYRVGDPSIQNRNPSNGQSVQSEYAVHGIHIMLGNNDVHAGINRVAELMGSEPPRLFVDPSCKNLIRELRTYRWDEWANKKANMKNQPKNNPRKRDDHAVDALRYLVMSRPFFDTGNGPIQQDFAWSGTDMYATNSLYPQRVEKDWRNGYDSELGSDW